MVNLAEQITGIKFCLRNEYIFLCGHVESVAKVLLWSNYGAKKFMSGAASSKRAEYALKTHRALDDHQCLVCAIWTIYQVYHYEPPFVNCCLFIVCIKVNLSDHTFITYGIKLHLRFTKFIIFFKLSQIHYLSQGMDRIYYFHLQKWSMLTT